MKAIHILGVALGLTALAIAAGESGLLTSGGSTEVNFDSTSKGGWFAYRGPTTEGGTSSENLTVTANTTAGYIRGSIDLSESPYTYGAIGFTWLNGGTTADLSDYASSGICLDYASTDTVTVKMEGASTKSVTLAAASTETVVYIPFTTFGWAAAGLGNQKQVEFDYRTSGGSLILTVYKMGLGSTACGTITAESSSSEAVSSAVAVSSSSIAAESSSGTVVSSSSIAGVSSSATAGSSSATAVSSSSINGQLVWLPKYSTRVKQDGTWGGYWWKYASTGISMTPTTPTTAANISSASGVVAEFAVTSADNDGAEVGFNWNTTETTQYDVSAYKGLCLEYRNDVASAGYIALKQKYAADSDPKYILALPKATSATVGFFAFDDFEIENWGTSYDRDMTLSLGIMFITKKATTLGIYKVALADQLSDCEPIFEGVLESSSSAATSSSATAKSSSATATSSATTPASSSSTVTSSSATAKSSSGTATSSSEAKSSSSISLAVSDVQTNVDSCTYFMNLLVNYNVNIQYHIAQFCKDSDGDGTLNWAEEGTATQNLFDSLTKGIDLSEVEVIPQIASARDATFGIQNGMVSFTSLSAQEIRIDAFSLLGQHIATIFHGYAQGTKIIAWKSKLPNGTYLIRFSQGSYNKNIKYTVH